MIDTENLQTASLYINNQLLSRGLLRDGQNIDFAHLGWSEGSTSDTVGQIIQVLNDLILRRDRDAEQRESLSTTMRDLRIENQKHARDVTRLSEQCAEAQRKSDVAILAESSLRTQMKSAESAMRELKDELARTKALVSQARASCATEIRRRDRQIDSLKKQVGEAGRARGAKASSAITTIAVTGDFNIEGARPSTRGGNETAEDYSLRSETNAFLAKLAQDLSEENESLLGVLDRTRKQLRQMSGWIVETQEDTYAEKEATWADMAAELEAVIAHMRTILTNPSFVPIEEVVVREEEINRLKAGWLKMESRWEDAVHLMDSWRKRMAASGKPVGDEDLKMGLHLSPVRVSNVLETRAGREPGLPAVKEDIDEDVDMVQSPCPSQGSKHTINTEEDYDRDGVYDSESDSSTYDDEMEEMNGQLEELSVKTTDEDVQASRESPPLPEPPQLSPLKNSISAGNRGLHLNKVRQHPTTASTATRGTSRSNTRAGSGSKAPLHRAKAVTQPLRAGSRPGKAAEPGRSVSTTSLDEALLSNHAKKAAPAAEQRAPTVAQPEAPQKEGEQSGGFKSNPRRGPVRVSKTRTSDSQPQQSPVTMSNIAAKLAASEKEADTARVRAKLKAVRTASGGVQRPVIAPAATSEPPKQGVEVEPKPKDEPEEGDPTAQEEEKDQQQQQEQKPDKRKRERRAAKATSRRRSTLSPLELQSLIAGSV